MKYRIEVVSHGLLYGEDAEHIRWRRILRNLIGYGPGWTLAGAIKDLFCL